MEIKCIVIIFIKVEIYKLSLCFLFSHIYFSLSLSWVALAIMQNWVASDVHKAYFLFDDIMTSESLLSVYSMRCFCYFLITEAHFEGKFSNRLGKFTE